MKQNQHYIPRVYLKNFSSVPNKINVYNIIKKESYEAGIRAVASKENFYTKNLENFFSTWESKYDKFFIYIKNNGFLPDKSSQEFKNFIMFLALQNIRHEYSKDVLSQLSVSFMQPLLEAQYDKDDKSGIIPNSIKEKLGKNGIVEHFMNNININPKWIDWQFHNHIFEAINSDEIKVYQRLLLFRSWELICTNNSFITSDNPICIIRNHYSNSPYGIGFATPQTSLIYPISSKYCLVGYLDSPPSMEQSNLKEHLDNRIQRHQLKQVRQIEEIETSTINDIIASYSHKFIYSSKDISEKYKGKEYRNPLKIN